MAWRKTTVFLPSPDFRITQRKNCSPLTTPPLIFNFAAHINANIVIRNPFLMRPSVKAWYDPGTSYLLKHTRATETSVKFQTMTARKIRKLHHLLEVERIWILAATKVYSGTACRRAICALESPLTSFCGVEFEGFWLASWKTVEISPVHSTNLRVE